MRGVTFHEICNAFQLGVGLNADWFESIGATLCVRLVPQITDSLPNNFISQF